MTTNRIEAAVQAEAVHIDEWRHAAVAMGYSRYWRLIPQRDLSAVARHLVANRIQVQDAQVQALVAALVALIAEAPKQAVEGSVDRMTFSYAMRQARNALKPFEEMKP